MLRNPSGAQAAAGLLIRQANKCQRAARGHPAHRHVTNRRGHGCRDVQHVRRTAPKNLAVYLFGTKRIARPLRRIHRHHIRMPQQGQRLRGGIRALNRKRHGHAPRVGFEVADVDGQRGVGKQKPLAEKLLQRVRIADLLAGIGREIIHARVADQVFEQGKCGILGRREARSNYGRFHGHSAGA